MTTPRPSPHQPAALELDYRTAFDLAPVGMVLSRNRLMVDCNRQVLAMFGAEREQLVGQSFEVLYPTHDEFERTGERIAASLDRQGWYSDERVMKRVDSAGGAQRGELFWCHVSGRALGNNRSITGIGSICWQGLRNTSG